MGYLMVNLKTGAPKGMRDSAKGHQECLSYFLFFLKHNPLLIL